MIVYFSGTGNSRLVARELATLMNETLFSVNDWQKRPNEQKEKELPSSSPYVFVVPTYAWKIPPLFSEFLKTVQWSQGQHAYFIMTCGDNIARASHYNQKKCKKIGLDYKGTFRLVMPENYIALFNTPDRDKAVDIIQKALAHLPSIAKTIEERSPFKKLPYRIGDFLSSSFIHWLFFRFIVNDKKYYVTEKCVKCGLCARRCPTNNIDMVERKPVWLHHCTHCMACIGGCPVRAIEYGKVTKNRFRYYID